MMTQRCSSLTTTTNTNLSFQSQHWEVAGNTKNVNENELATKALWVQLLAWNCIYCQCGFVSFPWWEFSVYLSVYFLFSSTLGVYGAEATRRRADSLVPFVKPLVCSLVAWNQATWDKRYTIGVGLLRSRGIPPEFVHGRADVTADVSFGLNPYVQLYFVSPKVPFKHKTSIFTSVDDLKEEEGKKRDLSIYFKTKLQSQENDWTKCFNVA